jgi:hypothetical protein
MPNCTNCGNPLDASDMRCGRCGAMVPNQSQGQRRSGYTSTQQIAYPKNIQHGSRSIKVPILAALSLIAGIESFLYVGKLNYNPKLSQLNQLPSMVGFVSPYMPYILELTGVIALVASFGYLKRMSWAWKIGVASAVLSAFTITAPNLIGFLLGVACLGMLMMPSIRSSLRH